MKTYELLWRNKFLTIDAKSFDDIIKGLESAVKILKEMKKTNKITYDGGADDDYARFITTDKGIADKFGFEEIDEMYE